MSGKNNEYRLDVIDSFILPDFFDKTTGKIIEFDGVYYHRKSPQNELREIKRDGMISDSGYQVLHVNELEYKNDKMCVINKCLNFLKN
jgi:very-short-patch-repair endonuclease